MDNTLPHARMYYKRMLINTQTAIKPGEEESNANPRQYIMCIRRWIWATGGGNQEKKLRCSYHRLFTLNTDRISRRNFLKVSYILAYTPQRT